MASNTKTSTPASKGSPRRTTTTASSKSSKASAKTRFTPEYGAKRSALPKKKTLATRSATPTPAPAKPSPTESTESSLTKTAVSSDIDPQAELASRILSRRRLLPFTQRINPRYLAGWVHEDICRRLENFSEDVAKGLSPRLMLLMPPRHGKSELASRMFPAWHLGKYPDHEIIASSYNVGLAMSFSRKVKEVMSDPSYMNVFDTRLNPNFQGAEEWGIDAARGGYVAAGVGGGITGKGAHVLTIDDPIKNAEEADSADNREKLKDWYDSTAYTRLAPGGGVLIVQTWWHDDDLAGRLQVAMAGDAEADQFIVVKYPAIAEADEYLDYDTDLIVSSRPDNGKLLRLKGEALHPDRYDIQKLNRIKKTIQPRFWSALYQQNPVPDDGAYFLKENFRRQQLPAIKASNVFIAFDFAISEKKQNDYTVGIVGLQDQDDILHMADMVRFKSGDSFFIVEAILNLTSKWYSPSLVLGFEDGQIYRAIEALLKKRMRERRAYPSIVVLKPISDKMARARPLQGRMQQGMVSFDDKAEWYEGCKTEMLRFPAGVHDDQVDALAWVTQMAIGREPPRKPKPKEPDSWRKKLGNLTSGGSHMTA
jgi:predicted phage terminase large subunit-like protein